MDGAGWVHKSARSSRRQRRRREALEGHTLAESWFAPLRVAVRTQDLLVLLRRRRGRPAGGCGRIVSPELDVTHSASQVVDSCVPD